MTNTYALSDQTQLTHDGPRRYVLRVRDMAEAERPREKMLSAGVGTLTSSELLAVIWGTGTVKEDVLAMASRTITDYGEKAIINETNPTRLAELAGISEGKASQLIASLELGRRQYSIQQGRQVYLRNAKHAYTYLKEMAHSPKEQLRVLYLNNRYRIIHDEVISVGTLTSNLVHPREVFKPAIDRGAVAIIVAHNHPSGDREPTTADMQVTNQLLNAGDMLGIELLDHLVIVPSGYLSLLQPDRS